MDSLAGAGEEFWRREGVPPPIVFARVRKLQKRRGLRRFLGEWFAQRVRKRLKTKDVAGSREGKKNSGRWEASADREMADWECLQSVGASPNTRKSSTSTLLCQ